MTAHNATKPTRSDSTDGRRDARPTRSGRLAKDGASAPAGRSRRRDLSRRCVAAFMLACCAAPPACGQGLFEPATAFETTYGAFHPTALAVADWSGDGALDLVFTTTDSFIVGSYVGDGAGGFAAGPSANIPFTFGGAHRRMVGTGDADGDGRADAFVMPNVVTGVGESVRCVFGGPSALTVGPIVLTAAGGGAPNPRVVAVGDMDNDGLVEVVMATIYVGVPGGAGCDYIVANGGGSTITFHDWSPATMSWVQNAAIALPGVNVVQIAVGDFDGDGWRDVVAESCGGIASSNHHVRLLRQPLGPSPSTVGPWPIDTNVPWNSPYGQRAVGDFNGDGLDDFALAFDASVPAQYVMKTFPGDALAGLGPVSVVTYSAAAPAPIFDTFHFALPVGDFDDDGADDAVCRTIAVRPGVAASTVGLPLVSAGAPVACGDFDGDGDSDLVLLGETGFYPNAVRTYSTALSAGRYRPPCVAAGTYPTFETGSAYLGNAGFFLAIAGAAPSAPYAFGVSLQLGPLTSNGCTFWPSVDGADLLLPNVNLGVGVTDAAGNAYLALPLPAAPALLFATVHAQAAVVDALGPFGVFGGALTLSDARRIVIW